MSNPGCMYDFVCVFARLPGRSHTHTFAYLRTRACMHTRRLTSTFVIVDNARRRQTHPQYHKYNTPRPLCIFNTRTLFRNAVVQRSLGPPARPATNSGKCSDIHCLLTVGRCCTPSSRTWLGRGVRLDVLTKKKKKATCLQEDDWRCVSSPNKKEKEATHLHEDEWSCDPSSTKHRKKQQASGRTDGPALRTANKQKKAKHTTP